MTVIPTVYWGEPQSYWFCFDGIEKGCTVAISMIGIKKEKDLFLQGYKEMLKRVEPAQILCYGDPFPDMDGKIITVDYAQTNNLNPEKEYGGYQKYFTYTQDNSPTFSQQPSNPAYTPEGYTIKTTYGYVISKGGGSGGGGGGSRGNPSPQGGGGTLKGSLAGLTDDEKRVVQELLAQGKNVEIIPKDPKSQNKTPDFKVDGVLTELKTLQNPNTNTGMKRIQEAFSQGAENVIIDGRKAGLTHMQAQEIIDRFLGKFVDTLSGTIEIWTNEGIIRYP